MITTVVLLDPRDTSVDGVNVLTTLEQKGVPGTAVLLQWDVSSTRK